jgi:hypothetical protein
MILSARAKVVVTKGRSSQNHGLKAGEASITMMIIKEMKKNTQYLPVDSLVSICKIWRKDN